MTTQVGGDSPNTMPTAIAAGMTAGQIRQVTLEPGAKFSMDAFKKSLAQPGQLAKTIKDASISNMALSDALAQQNGATRFAAKIPFVRNFLGPDFLLNDAIGALPDHTGWLMKLRSSLPFWKPGPDPLMGVSKAKITQIALAGGDVAKNLKNAGLPAETAQKIAEAASQRAAGLSQKAVQQVTQQATQAAAGQALDDIAKGAMDITLKEAFREGGKDFAKRATQESVKAALAKGGDDAIRELTRMGFYKQSAEKLVQQATTATAAQVAQQAAGASGNTLLAGAKKFAGNLLSGAKGNFVVAGVFSLATNAIQVAQGQMNVPQFLGLTAMDTAAYGTIGMGAAAAGAAIGTLIPVPFLGTLAGFAIGFAAGWVYEKTLRDPAKGVLGLGSKSGASNKSEAPAAVTGPGVTSPAASPSADPYAEFDALYQQQLQRLTNVN